ncbi:PREDICTED: malignant fibrous histiocytoma-amplified sequence 1 [Tinamus guttatus]|uniref:malignant fibrous histiocytoma-amplified sequence 1 n=1 Tax=Tinamus guttatus TaxID=94827 RepID=UPI00052E8C19|nr:PREDICTED: malignant fibrous histiocytoma-amplified sequence 1 [Tinamus guttatus]
MSLAFTLAASTRRLTRDTSPHNRLRALGDGDGAALAALGSLRKLSLSHNELGIPQAPAAPPARPTLSASSSTSSVSSSTSSSSSSSTSSTSLSTSSTSSSTSTEPTSTSSLLPLSSPTASSSPLPRLAGLGSLEELDLSFNRLRRLPEGLGRLRHLRALDVDHNLLPAFPAPLLELSALEELDCSGNRHLGALPEGIAALRRLKTLWLSGTGLVALPEGLCQLGALESLMLDGNSLRALPAGFGRLQRLKTLNLSSNLLADFPDAVLALGGLEELYLSRNQLTLLPARLGSLEELVLQGNHIAILPEGFGQLARVTLWKIKDNPLIQPPYEVCMKGIPYIAAYQQELAHSQPALQTHAALPNIWTAWQAITPLLEELNALLQEWPGLHYTVHVLCSKCLKRGSPNPHAFPATRHCPRECGKGPFGAARRCPAKHGARALSPRVLSFPGELLSQPRPEGLTEIICPKNGSERVNVALVYPPTPTVASPCSK